MSDKRSLMIGTLIAIAMAVVFAFGSPGRALLVTFVPGVAFAWIAFVFLSSRARPLPAAESFLPVFGLAFAVQLLHFAEEFAGGFQSKFARIYGGEAIPDAVFVAFNMSAYAVFLLSALAVIFLRLRAALVPVLFFAVYGVVGNAITHTAWTLLKGGYSPGLVTSLGYWVLGPLLLARLGLNRRELSVLIVVFAIVLLAAVLPTIDMAVLRAG